MGVFGPHLVSDIAGNSFRCDPIDVAFLRVGDALITQDVGRDPRPAAVRSLGNHPKAAIEQRPKTLAPEACGTA